MAANTLSACIGADMSDDERPTGRELRLVNAAIRLLTFLEVEGVLSEPALMKIDELQETCGLYKAHMLHPKMKQHTLIPVRVISPKAD